MITDENGEDLHLPSSIVRGLQKLQAYCQDYLSEETEPDTVLLAFWKIPDDDLFFAVLGFLPLFVPPIAFADVTVPEGFRIAWPIFILEDDYHINGWTAFRNFRTTLPDTVLAYERAGLSAEATAVRAAIAALDQGLEDEQVGSAYLAAGSPYQDDDARSNALEMFFCANRALFEPVSAWPPNR